MLVQLLVMSLYWLGYWSLALLLVRLLGIAVTSACLVL
jgi:hypothetical protein